MLEIELNDTDSNVRTIVVGVGGAGNNAVNRMAEEGIRDVEFVCVNADEQQLRTCKAPVCLQIGEQAAEESREDLADVVRGADMVFVICGMGGGAAPVVAQIAKEMGILTVGIVTELFKFGAKACEANAVNGIAKLKEFVDTLIVIPNDDRRMADKVLQQGIQVITDLINVPGLLNVDFEDVQTAMKDQGIAHIGIGVGHGDEKCMEAVKQAASSPLLEAGIGGASHVIINVSGDIGLIEVNDAANFVLKLAGGTAQLLVGAMYDEAEQDEATITVIATGLG